jgi:hypothetical protein
VREEIDQEMAAVLYLPRLGGWLEEMDQESEVVSSEVGLMVGGSSHAGRSVLKLHDKDRDQGL